ncbi:MAG: YARHG domain-containing protein [Deltaproteobacteria bacterium]|nr:YARHG domain-containing protein [Deltaproteobacteria bacterium]
MRALVGPSASLLLVLACGDARPAPPPPAPIPVVPAPSPPASTSAPTPPAPPAPPLVPTPSAQSAPSPAPTPAAQTPAASPAPPTAPARPLAYETAIAPADLEGRSLRELSILRNTPFAKRGHTFRRPWLVAYFGAQPWYRAARVVEIDALSELDRQNVDAITRHDLGLSRGTLERMRDELVARDRSGRRREGDDVEAVLLGSRLGTRIRLANAAGGEGADPTVTALEDPSRLDALLTAEELRRLSRRDLRILRNTVYARRGRTFRSGLVRDYFAAASWYRPNPAYTDELLTQMDRDNIRMIQSVEQENGGPLRGSGDDLVAA